MDFSEFLRRLGIGGHSGAQVSVGHGNRATKTDIYAPAYRAKRKKRRKMAKESRRRNRSNRSNRSKR